MFTVDDPAGRMRFANPSNVPAFQPPPGVVGDIENPDSRVYIVRILVIFYLVLPCIFVAIRIYTRVYINRALWYDDYVTLLCLPVGAAWSAFALKLGNGAAGIRTWDLSLAQALDSVKNFAPVNALFILYLGCIKVSILLLYLRIFGSCHRLRRSAYGVISLVAGFSVAAFFPALLECRPREKRWNGGPGYCINADALAVTSCAINILTDFLILILPMPCVWLMRLPLRQKLTISVLFAAGSLVCVVSMVRLKFFLDLARDPETPWAAFWTVILSALEAGTAVICGCLPSLKPFLKHLFPKTFGRLAYGPPRSGNSSSRPTVVHAKAADPSSSKAEITSAPESV